MHSQIIKHFKTADPVMHAVLIKVHAEHGDKLFELKKSEDLFYDLCESIVSQQLSVKAGDTIFNRVLDLLPGRILTPDNVLKQKPEVLRAAGLSNAKVKYILDLALKVKTGEVNLEKLDELQNEEVITELTRVKGIGKWTAEMFLMFGLGRPDVFSHGDVGLQNAVKKIYGFEKYDPVVVEEIIVNWSPYRTIAARILWRSLKLN